MEMGKECIITKHGIERCRQRLGINKSAVDKNVEKALNYGVSHKDAKGSLSKYLDKLFFVNKTNNIRIYNRNVYIFANNILITVYSLPHELVKIADKLQKKKKNELSDIA